MWEAPWRGQSTRCWHLLWATLLMSQSLTLVLVRIAGAQSREATLFKNGGDGAFSGSEEWCLRQGQRLPGPEGGLHLSGGWKGDSFVHLLEMESKEGGWYLSHGLSWMQRVDGVPSLGEPGTEGGRSPSPERY